ncbi:MAG: hypothetical protein ACHQ2Z_08530 [Elusimicrobiota bacterium]
MNSIERRSAAACAAALGVSFLLFSATFGRRSVAQPVDPTANDKATPPPSPETVIQKWAMAPQVTARAMIAKYGQPSRWNEAALTWTHNGPWEKTVVYRRWWPRFLGKRDKDCLEQTIAYRVPAEKVDDLKRFDRRLSVDASRSLLSSRSESEPQNFLTLNLADEIITEKRSVEEARDFYAKTEKLSRSGKSSAYMDGLLFPSRSGDLRIDDHLGIDYDRNMMP